MRTSKKIFRASLGFILTAALLSSVLGAASNDESQTVPENTNYIFCGASHCECGVIPDIIDAEMGTNSFNLSVMALKLYGRYELLNNVLPQVSADTVAMDITYQTLSRIETETGVSDMRVQRFLGNYVTPGYLFTKPFSLERLQETFSGLMSTGFDVLWQRVNRGLAGDFSHDAGLNYFKNLHRGYDAYDSRDVSLEEDKIVSTYLKYGVNNDYITERIELTEETIALCRQNNAEVVIFVTPISDAFIWQNNGLDIFHDMLMKFCEKNSCELYDFNLLKTRYEHYSDKVAYYDADHLSAIGAEQFSRDYAFIMNKVAAGEDVSEYFYESYEEMRADSPYMEYYLSHVSNS